MAEQLWGELVADLGDEMQHLVKEELLRGWHADAVLAATRQRRIAQANDRLENCAIEGIGAREMSIDADSYFAWQGVNPGCWQDRDFRSWFKKKNPESVVKYTPRNTTILVP
jgi:hypothetical protein